MARNHQALNHSPISNMVGPSRQRKRPSPILLVKSEKPIPKAPQTRSVKEASTNPSLLTYNEIPEWYQDNECIVYGYRPPTNSTAKCFASWVYIHNETFNIFSHLLPAILSVVCAGVMPSYFFNQYPVATTGDQLVFGFFLLSVVVCLSLSSTYHTLMNHSASVSKTWLRLDYVGIMILTLGDFISGIYLVFYCEPTLQRVYWTMVSADPIMIYEIRLIPCADIDLMHYYCSHPCPSQIPGASLSYIACHDIRIYWSLWLCSPHTRYSAIRYSADEQAEWHALLSGRRLTPSSWCFIIYHQAT